MNRPNRPCWIEQLIPHHLGQVEIQREYPPEVEETLIKIAWLLGECRAEYQGLIQWLRNDVRVVGRARSKDRSDWNQMWVEDENSRRVLCARQPFPRLGPKQEDSFYPLGHQLLHQLAPQRCDRADSLQALCQELMFTPVRSFFSGKWFEYYLEQVVVRFLEQSKLRGQFVAERNLVVSGGTCKRIEIDFLLLLPHRSFYFEAKSGKNRGSLKRYLMRVGSLNLPSPEFVLVTVQDWPGKPIHRKNRKIPNWRVEVNQLRRHILAPLVQAS